MNIAKVQTDKARYYNPSTGRFLSEDPIGFRGGDNNFYRYVSNNPMKYFDPLGLLQMCHRPLKVMPKEYGPLRHDYLKLKDGSTVSYSSYGSWFGGKGKNTSNDSGGTCEPEITFTKKQKKKIKDWVEKHKDDRYWLYGNNCRDFANEAIICAIEGC